MTDRLTECITNLIEQPPEDIGVKQKRIKKLRKETTLSKSETYSNHHKLFHQKIIYNKPWKISRDSKKDKVELYEQKIIGNEKEPILLPKDPVTLCRINFPKANVLNIKKSQPPKLKQRYVDSRFGDAHDLIPSGLHPVYIHRKKKIPKFLKDRKASVTEKTHAESEEDIYKQLQNVNKDFSKSTCKYITPEERNELLNNMKKRWDQLMSEFQILPFVISTPPQIKRKSKLENKLRQLEKDIDTIEQHKLIFVYDDGANKNTTGQIQ